MTCTVSLKYLQQQRRSQELWTCTVSLKYLQRQHKSQESWTCTVSLKVLAAAAYEHGIMDLYGYLRSTCSGSVGAMHHGAVRHICTYSGSVGTRHL